jgi:AbrB family looped-hinge helix DNA binding protein
MYILGNCSFGEGFIMNVAVLSSGGQVTIPVDIRRKLGLRDGDKIVFAERGEEIVIDNSNRKVWKEFQKGMEGAAEEAGFSCEQDVVDFCKEIRREMWNERDENNIKVK